MDGKLKSVHLFASVPALKSVPAFLFSVHPFCACSRQKRCVEHKKAEIREGAEGTRNYRVSRLAAKQQNAVYAIMSAAWGLTRFDDGFCKIKYMADILF